MKRKLLIARKLRQEFDVVLDSLIDVVFRYLS